MVVVCSPTCGEGWIRSRFHHARCYISYADVRNSNDVNTSLQANGGGGEGEQALPTVLRKSKKLSRSCQS